MEDKLSKEERETLQKACNIYRKCRTVNKFYRGYLQSYIRNTMLFLDLKNVENRNIIKRLNYHITDGQWKNKK